MARGAGPGQERVRQTATSVATAARRISAATLPTRLRPYLLTFDADGKPTGLQADRYEFWLYRQLRKRLKSGELYLDDSLQHRCFTDELVSLDEKADVLGAMDIPWLRQPIGTQLDALTVELRQQWLAFNRELHQGKLTHLDYDRATQKLTWRKPKADPDAARQGTSTNNWRSATWPTYSASSTTSASSCRH